MLFSIADILEQFPTYRAGVVVAAGMHIVPERPPELERDVHAAEQLAAQTLAGTALADVPELRAWREAYKAFGVKKTSYRSSVERLLKRIQQGMELPRVNSLVDSYNTVSIQYRMPVGADDLARVAPPIAFRYARPDDTFVAMGDESRTPDPPRAGEVVYADAEKCLCRRWNWYQDARSAISGETTRAVLTVQAIEPESAARVEEAVERLCALLAAHCGASTTWAVADRRQPEVELAG